MLCGGTRNKLNALLAVFFLSDICYSLLIISCVSDQCIVENILICSRGNLCWEAQCFFSESLQNCLLNSFMKLGPAVLQWNLPVYFLQMPNTSMHILNKIKNQYFRTALQWLCLLRYLINNNNNSASIFSIFLSGMWDYHQGAVAHYAANQIRNTRANANPFWCFDTCKCTGIICHLICVDVALCCDDSS